MNKANVLKARELTPDFTWALQLAARYTVHTDIPYFKTTDGTKLELDVYVPNRAGAQLRPALMFIHAGGWLEGCTRESWALWFLPFLQLGWVVINVGYRLSNVALAPAAVEDCLRALQWTTRSAGEYGVDAQQLVIGGLSAGGHLALTTAMIPAFLARSHAEPRTVLDIIPTDLLEAAPDFIKPKAIINWCGITDVADVMRGAHRQDFAAKWVGERPNAMAIATAVSPLSYVQPGGTPVITIHGDQDAVVPYSHATRLHRALSRAGVSNELITLSGSGHAFEVDAHVRCYPRIMGFLQQHGLSVSAL